MLSKKEEKSIHTIIVCLRFFKSKISTFDFHLNFHFLLNRSGNFRETEISRQRKKESENTVEIKSDNF